MWRELAYGTGGGVMRGGGLLKNREYEIIEALM